MTLACELHRRGIGCRVIDRVERRFERVRAVDVQSRTLEVLEQVVQYRLPAGQVVAGRVDERKHGARGVSVEGVVKVDAVYGDEVVCELVGFLCGQGGEAAGFGVVGMIPVAAGLFDFGSTGSMSIPAELSRTRS